MLQYSYKTHENNVNYLYIIYILFVREIVIKVHGGYSS